MKLLFRVLVALGLLWLAFDPSPSRLTIALAVAAGVSLAPARRRRLRSSRVHARRRKNPRRKRGKLLPFLVPGKPWGLQ